MRKGVSITAVVAVSSMTACGAYDPWELRLQSVDWHKLNTANVRLHYVEGDALLQDPDRAGAYLENCHSWHTYLSAIFTAPEQKVFIYKFRDGEHWEEVLGASSSSTGAIRPYNATSKNPQIMLSGYGSVGHEMVHIMTYNISEPAPTLLFEGLAVTYSGQLDPETEIRTESTIDGFDIPAGTDGEFEGGPVHQCGAEHHASRDLWPRELLSMWDILRRGNGLYCVGGSFVKHLIDTHGLERFMRAFRAASRSQLLGTSVAQALEETYDTSMDDLEQSWHDQLALSYPEQF